MMCVVWVCVTYELTTLCEYDMRKDDIIFQCFLPIINFLDVIVRVQLHVSSIGRELAFRDQIQAGLTRHNTVIC